MSERGERTERSEFGEATVIVTGAGSGIGRALVEGFAGDGARVVAVDVDADRLAFVSSRWDSAVPVEADLATAAGIERVIDVARGRWDVLCNNVGVIDRFHLVDTTTDELWEQMLAINLTAAFQLSREAVRRMSDGAGGAIVNTSSIAGLRGGRAGAAYTAAKHGLVGLTLNLAATVGHRGIRCNAVCPGGVSTAIWDGVDIDPSGAERIKGRDRHRPPAAAPRDVAAVVMFLASASARHVNGALIPIDAGAMAF